MAITAGERERLLQRARAWLAEDPDRATREELESEIERGALDRIGVRFGEPLRFGTAGIRGPLGAGPACMNLATVRRVSASLAAELLAEQTASPHTGGAPSVAIGRDARHGSERFAAEVAAVLSGAGVRVLGLPEPLPTPVLAFAVRDLGCSAGVMVTASHNPRDQNGLKIYWRGGLQIVAPLDERIARRMGSLRELHAVALGDGGVQLDGRVLEAYLALVAGLPSSRPAQAHGARQPRILYTPLHGVGARTLMDAFAHAGRPAPELFGPQADPDPDFPGLERPNPEEPEALAALLAAAGEGSYELALANDPDADRLAAAIPTRGGWRVLDGDEIGALLGEHVLRRTGAERGLLVSSVASSTLLAELAHAEGVGFAQTLTGFKWIMRAAAAVQGGHERLIFGYEEALGFAVTDAVRDKDGISAALALAACAEEAALEGGTLQSRLDEIGRRLGLHATARFNVRLERAEAAGAAQRAMRSLRRRPPRELCGEPVDFLEDLLEPSDALSRSPARADRARIPGLPPADVLVFGCGERARVVVRPSGSEPKLKVYLQSVQPAGEDPLRARRRAREHLGELEREMRTLVQASAAAEV